MITKLLAGPGEKEEEEEEEEGEKKGKKKGNEERLRELVELDAENSPHFMGAGTDDDVFISFNDASAIADLRGKAIGDCLSMIEPVVTPDYILYRIPTKKIEEALLKFKR